MGGIVLHWNKEPLARDPYQYAAAVRTQLSDISGASQMLKRNATEQEKQYLAIINRAVIRTAQTVYEEELARRLEDDYNLQANYAAVDLADWFRRTTERAAELLAEAGIRLQCSCKDSVILTLADRELLDEMLYALLSNAARAAKGRVLVYLARREENAVLTVGDEGAGMDEAALERLLGTDAVPDLTPGAGAGIGLRLCRAIAELHGGILMLETGPDTGTRAAVTLKIREDQCLHPLESPNLGENIDRALFALSGVLPLQCFS